MDNGNYIFELVARFKKECVSETITLKLKSRTITLNKVDEVRYLGHSIDELYEEFLPSINMFKNITITDISEKFTIETKKYK